VIPRGGPDDGRDDLRASGRFEEEGFVLAFGIRAARRRYLA
jgi:hypothetical protein